MAFDAGMVLAVASELYDRIVGARIEKVHQPERDEIVLLLHIGRENLRLVISASPNNPRIHLSNISKENPSAPPMFCTMLRKYLTGAKVLSVRTIGFERIIFIDFEAHDDLGYPFKVTLVAEIMGKYSNIIFCHGDNMKILGAIRPVDFTTSRVRQVLSGMLYEAPPAQDKKNPLEETREGFFESVYASEKRADKFITDTYLGISSLVAREIAYRGEGSNEALCDEFFKLVNILKEKSFKAVMIVDESSRPVEYAFFDIMQYSGMKKVYFDSISQLIETFFTSRDNSERVKQRAADIFKLLTNTKARLEKKTAIQLSELEECEKKEEMRKYGELITASIYMLKKGMTHAKVIDYYKEDTPEIMIPLDIRLTPAQNAQAYFKKYTKMKNAELEISKQIENTERETAYIDSVLDSLSRASGQSELDEIRRELSESGYSSVQKQSSSKKAQISGKPIEYITSGGYRLLCGKNNLQNDYITTKLAEKSDWWFHIKNAPGSHVIMLANGEEPSAEDFTEAATVAAYNSSLSEGKNVSVDYTLIKHIKKPSASKPGFVTYTTYWSAVVTPDAELCERLKKSK
ncbi:MAG: NFACT family protein [Clostridia bacterium]|nr:NFACT family protein [Clostridia bacterium]